MTSSIKDCYHTSASILTLVNMIPIIALYKRSPLHNADRKQDNVNSISNIYREEKKHSFCFSPGD